MKDQQTDENTAGADTRRSSPASGSVDPFPKWKWMMDYCRERKWHPSDFWNLAEKSWCEKFELNAKDKTCEESSSSQSSHLI